MYTSEEYGTVHMTTQCVYNMRVYKIRNEGWCCGFYKNFPTYQIYWIKAARTTRIIILYLGIKTIYYCCCVFRKCVTRVRCIVEKFTTFFYTIFQKAFINSFLFYYDYITRINDTFFFCFIHIIERIFQFVTSALRVYIILQQKYMYT